MNGGHQRQRFGTPNNLFIEDAVQEVQVGLSNLARYVASAAVLTITRSGGTLSGACINRPTRSRTPFEKSVA
jgi:hypothetical protein